MEWQNHCAKDEWERMMTKAVEMALFQHFLGGTEENYKTYTAMIDGLQTGS
jgi:hypothetical protein